MIKDQKTSMTHDSKFAIISPKSVKLFAEIVGAPGLTDDLASSLAEDATYRLRETLQVAVEWNWHYLLFFFNRPGILQLLDIFFLPHLTRTMCVFSPFFCVSIECGSIYETWQEKTTDVWRFQQSFRKKQYWGKMLSLCLGVLIVTLSFCLLICPLMLHLEQ